MNVDRIHKKAEARNGINPFKATVAAKLEYVQNADKLFPEFSKRLQAAMGLADQEVKHAAALGIAFELEKGYVIVAMGWETYEGATSPLLLLAPDPKFHKAGLLKGWFLDPHNGTGVPPRDRWMEFVHKVSQKRGGLVT